MCIWYVSFNTMHISRNAITCRSLNHQIMTKINVFKRYNMQHLRCCNMPLDIIIHCNKLNKNVKQTPKAKIEVFCLSYKRAAYYSI